MKEGVDAFGPQAATLLRAAEEHLARSGTHSLPAFYKGLFRDTKPHDVITRLTYEQFQTIQIDAEEQLRSLLDPDLNLHSHETRAFSIGQKYALTGVETSWLVGAYETHLKQLMKQIDTWPGSSLDRASLGTILTSRLMIDLKSQIRGREAARQTEQDAISQMGRLAETSGTFTDLIGKILEILMDLDGMCAGIFAKPDPQGAIQYEIMAGETLGRHVRPLTEDDLMPTIRADDPRGQGLLGRAWRSGEIQQSFIVDSDPRLAPWRKFARERGYTASAAVPISDANGCPYAILSLYHRSPGYFATPDHTSFLEHLRAILGSAFTQSRYTGSIISHATRSSYRGLLSAGALVMLYQPVVDLKSGRMTKVEALARLQGPDGALIGPGDFLAAFGEHELRQLFAQGLRQALLDLKSWDAHGLVTGIAVNLPPQAFVDNEYLEIARRALRAVPIDPKRLTLELLENGEIDHRHDPHRILSAWRALGVRLAQDDLGTGYSSLIRMEQLALDDVKIDQSLVSTATQAPRKALQFIHHLTHLAHDIGTCVTVEGLEDAGLVEASAILGADSGQGYAIARPMSSDALLDWAYHAPFPADPNHPQTALGAYATMIIQNALMDLAAHQPALQHAIASQPCALSHYLRANDLQHTALGIAHAQLYSYAWTDSRAPSYIKAREGLEALLCAHIQKEAVRQALFKRAFTARRAEGPRTPIP